MIFSVLWRKIKLRSRVAAAIFVAVLLVVGGVVLLSNSNGDNANKKISPAVLTSETTAPAPSTPEDLDAETEGEPESSALTRAASGAADTFLQKNPADAWALADSLQPAMDTIWDDKIGAYASSEGLISTRMNAAMLRVHANAALKGHVGPARNDERARKLVAFLTGPAFLKKKKKGVVFGESRHNKPHIPGWKQSSGEVISQHPGVDATAAQSLAAAWNAAKALNLDDKQREAIQSSVVSVAESDEFRAPSRLLNQINWNADVYSAAATVGGKTELLTNDYRKQLHWFAAYAHEAKKPGQAPNLSAGNGFFYVPGGPINTIINRNDTVEYANISLGALGRFQQALGADMPALPEQDMKVLRDWAVHTINADWTPSGFLNWDSGKGQRRVYLRQYWALALEGAVNALRGGEKVTGIDAKQGDVMLARGIRLFRQWVADEKSLLLPATTFDFKTTFDSVAENRVTTTLRVSAQLSDWAASCGCDGKLPDPQITQAPLSINFDGGFKRLTVNSPEYATSIVPPTGSAIGGGLEPNWILNRDGRQLAALGGGGDGSLGLQLKTPNGLVLDTQPDLLKPAPEYNLNPVANQPSMLSGSIKNDQAQINVVHTFSIDKIETRYEIKVATKPAEVTLRIPSNGESGNINCVGGDAKMPGCGSDSAYIVGTPAKASMRVTVTGLPEGIGLGIVRPKARIMNPKPGREGLIRFKLDRDLTFTRTMDFSR